MAVAVTGSSVGVPRGDGLSPHLEAWVGLPATPPGAAWGRGGGDRVKLPGLLLSPGFALGKSNPFARANPISAGGG